MINDGMRKTNESSNSLAVGWNLNLNLTSDT